MGQIRNGWAVQNSTDFYIVNELNWGIVLVLLFGCLGWIQAA